MVCALTDDGMAMGKLRWGVIDSETFVEFLCEMELFLLDYFEGNDQKTFTQYKDSVVLIFKNLNHFTCTLV